MSNHDYLPYTMGERDVGGRKYYPRVTKRDERRMHYKIWVAKQLSSFSIQIFRNLGIHNLLFKISSRNKYTLITIFFT